MLRSERDDAVNRLAVFRDETERLKVDQAALFKVRAEMALLRQQTNELSRLAAGVRQLRNLQRVDEAQASVQPLSVLSDLERCRDNLRRISAAVEQYALEKKQVQGEKVYPGDILPYLVKKELPHCPAGGIYSLRGVGNDATCSMDGHTL